MTLSCDREEHRTGAGRKSILTYVSVSIVASSGWRPGCASLLATGGLDDGTFAFHSGLIARIEA